EGAAVVAYPMLFGAIGDLAAAGVVDGGGGEFELGVQVDQHGAGVGQAVGVEDQRGDRDAAAVDHLDGAVAAEIAGRQVLEGAGGAADRFDLAVIGDLAAAGVVDGDGGEFELGVQVDQHGAGV